MLLHILFAKQNIGLSATITRMTINTTRTPTYEGSLRQDAFTVDAKINALSDILTVDVYMYTSGCWED